MKYMKYILVILLFLLKGTFINCLNNINKFILNNDKIDDTKLKIMEEKYNNLYKEYNELSDLKLYSKPNYYLTRLSYRKTYSDYEFYIYGGKNQKIKKNNLLINKDGLIGLIKEIYSDYSVCTMLPGVKKMNIEINDSFGTINEFQNGLFIIEDFSNYDTVNINDKVYTSTLGDIRTKEYIGYVVKIDNNDINKKIYVKSDVDFNHVSYMYVVGEV